MALVCFAAVGALDAGAKTPKRSGKASKSRTQSLNADLLGKLDENCVSCDDWFFTLNGNTGKLTSLDSRVYTLKVNAHKGKTLIIDVYDAWNNKEGRLEGTYGTYNGFISDYSGTYYKSNGKRTSFMFDSYGD